MNMQVLLWIVVVAILIYFGREIWLDFRNWWVMSRAGYIVYRLKLRAIHLKIAARLRLYTWRLDASMIWQRIRKQWWKVRVNLGYEAEYPRYISPPSPFDRPK